MASMNVYKPIIDQKFSGQAPQIRVVPNLRRGVLSSSSLGSAGTVNLYTCPPGKKARLTFWSFFSQATNLCFVRINSTNLEIIPIGSTNAEYGVRQLNYDDAPELSPGDQVRFVMNAGGSGNFIFSALVTEEDLSSSA